jgi:uncharacterized protein (DUF885 family)
MNRRDLLAGSAGAVGLAALMRGTAALAQAAPGGAPAQLKAVFDRIMDQQLDRSPEFTTSLGLDVGARAAEKSRLDDRSIAAWEGDKVRTAEQLAALKGVDRAALGLQDQVNLDSVVYNTALQDQINREIPYIGGPYVISQLTGAYQSVPDFLDTQHAISTRQDAEDYLSRLAAFATAMDQEASQTRHDTGMGVTPPDFIITKSLVQMKTLRDQPASQSNLVQSLVHRTREKAIPGDWEARATTIYQGQVQPALDRQMALMNDLLPRSSHVAGCERLPDGEAFYALSLKNWTTSDMAPSDIHQLGLDLVAKQGAEIDAILKTQGLSQGTVGARLRHLYEDPRYRYPNTDAGKVQLIADLNKKVVAMQARLPAYFGALPKAKLEIHRVPKATEAGAPGGYYQPGALDGSRPGIYWINLRDTAEVPTWTLPTLTYHEGIPGHHLQLSLAQEAGLPLIRKTQFFSGYGEGWALYAENLAVEMGAYDDDPLGHVGQLHDSVFRAVRLVIDTGLHSQNWTREQAIKYYVEQLGDQDASATTEVERYCVWPGQACSYMLGKLDWLRLRAKAKAALGPRFDIKAFHDAGLLSGAMPLGVLDNRIDAYIRSV